MQALRSCRVLVLGVRLLSRFARLPRSLDRKGLFMRYLWLALAFLVAVASVLAGQLLGLSREATATLGTALTGFALFPFLKALTPKLSFLVWVIAVALGTAVTWLLYLGFSRFGG